MFKNFQNIGVMNRTCNNSTLRFDEACLELIADANISFWRQYVECEGCELQNVGKGNITLGTLWPVKYELRNDELQSTVCNGSYHFGEYGFYKINTTNGCKVVMTAEPDSPYLPLLEAIVALLAIATCWYLVKALGKQIIHGRLWNQYFSREDNELGSDTRALTIDSGLSQAVRSPTRSRLRSLDVFRGGFLAMMIFVNAGGGGYKEFNHAVWNGLNIADVVFPGFAWAMGASLVLSLNARLRTGTSRRTAFLQVARRSLYLALIGVLLGSHSASWDTLRLPGVLQRLAALYLIAGSLECAFMKTSHGLDTGYSQIRDLSAGWRQWLVTAILSICHALISTQAKVPGCPRGYMGPGGWHDEGQYYNCTGGVAGYLDRIILGSSHLYRGGSYRRLYGTTESHDPEGLLGTLSGVLIVQAGCHATRIMLAYTHARARIVRWMAWSVMFCLLGGALCTFSENGGPIPINKNLWSVSYCLVTAGLAFFIQTILYFLVDLKACWGGRPLYYAGQNILLLYVGSELLKKHFPLWWPLSHPTHAQLLVTHSATVLAWLAAAVALQRNKIFFSL